jgi:hypothetical protein
MTASDAAGVVSSGGSDILARLRALEDRVAITELMHSYCRHADNLDGRAMAALFVEDCEADYVPGGDLLVGRDQLNQMLSDALSDVVSGSHHITNSELRFDGADAAILACYMYSWQRFAEYPARADCHRWGRYEIRFVRVEQSWKFETLRLRSAGEYGGARIAEQIGREFPPVFS